MKERANPGVAFSHITVLAGFSVLALISVIVWQTFNAFTGHEQSIQAVSGGTLKTAHTSYGDVNWQVPPIDEASIDAIAAGEDPDGIAYIADNVAGVLLGSYESLAEAGVYTPEEGERVAGIIASDLLASVSYASYSSVDIQADSDTSYERMLTYRNDLRLALEPLLENPGYELGIFANYIESRDTKYLEQLRQAAQNYRAAVASAASLVVPEDAVPHHVEILNALSEFGATTERLSQHAEDAFASVALLRTYQSSETRLFTSFNTLAEYYKHKQS